MASKQPELPPIAHRIEDAARRLGVSRSTIYNLITTKELTPFKVGNRTLIAESELHRFVAARMGADR